ncbi:MAG: hypothetical protein Q8J64_10155 [Thermodesulfovibrionales bacterium]|nr:hypothetical protein [Thermodesulfovibrionales bacterium]
MEMGEAADLNENLLQGFSRELRVFLLPSYSNSSRFKNYKIPLEIVLSKVSKRGDYMTVQFNGGHFVWKV